MFWVLVRFVCYLYGWFLLYCLLDCVGFANDLLCSLEFGFWLFAFVWVIYCVFGFVLGLLIVVLVMSLWL